MVLLLGYRHPASEDWVYRIVLRMEMNALQLSKPRTQAADTRAIVWPGCCLQQLQLADSWLTGLDSCCRIISGPAKGFAAAIRLHMMCVGRPWVTIAALLLLSQLLALCATLITVL
jgi:hypothetical protein